MRKIELVSPIIQTKIKAFATFWCYQGHEEMGTHYWQVQIGAIYKRQPAISNKHTRLEMYPRYTNININKYLLSIICNQ